MTFRIIYPFISAGLELKFNHIHFFRLIKANVLGLTGTLLLRSDFWFACDL